MLEAEAGRGAFLHRLPEGYSLNPQLHPWPPTPTARGEVGKDNLAAQISAQLDADRARIEARLIKGGYTDPSGAFLSPYLETAGRLCICSLLSYFCCFIFCSCTSGLTKP